MKMQCEFEKQREIDLVVCDGLLKTQRDLDTLSHGMSAVKHQSALTSALGILGTSVALLAIAFFFYTLHHPDVLDAFRFWAPGTVPY